MRRTTTLLAAAALLLVTRAYGQSAKEQPQVPHAHYGRDGFWHCDGGYAAGESGSCEPIVAWRFSASSRLRELERSEESGDSAGARAQ
jgi:hypothetical protein